MLIKSMNSNFKLNFRKLISQSLAIAMIGACLTIAQSVPASAAVITIDCPGGGSYAITDGVVSNGLTCAGDVVIDPRATSIGDLAFGQPGTYTYNLTSIFTGENVVTIGWRAFIMNNALLSVRIGDKTTSISAEAFYNARHLQSVRTGRGLLSIGDLSFFADTPNFADNTPASDLVITVPTGAVIASPAFINRTGTAYYCGPVPSNLRALTPIQLCLNSISEIPGRVSAKNQTVTLTGVGFAAGDYLDFGTETKTVSVIGSTSGTVSLPVFPVSSSIFLRIVRADGGWAEAPFSVTDPCYTVIGKELTSGTSCAGNVVIPDGVETITAEAFKNNSDLTGVSFPTTLKAIRDRAFSGANLTTLVIPDNVLSIGMEAFFQNPNLESVTVGNGVTEIAGGAFAKNSNLSSVTLGNATVVIDNQAFFQNYALNSITLPSSLTRIGDSAFDYSGLTSIDLGEGLTEIGSLAFANLSAEFTSIVIPDSVVTLGVNIFGDNRSTSSLATVYYCYSKAVLDYDGSTDATAGEWTGLKTRYCSEGSKLTGIALSEGLLSDEFNSTRLLYNVVLDNRVESTDVSWSALMPDSTFEVQLGESDIFAPITETHTLFSLVPGINLFKIRVTSVDLTTKNIYSLNIDRALPPYAGPFQDLHVVDTTDTDSFFTAIAASSDAKKIISGVTGIGIRRSTDGGANWTLTSAPSKPWYSLVSSADGVNLVAASDDGELYYSVNSGDTWSPSMIVWGGSPQKSYGLTISANGQHVVLGTKNGIFFSDDAGANFSASRISSVAAAPASALPVHAYLPAISSNGRTILAAEWDVIYRSTDGGISWTAATLDGGGTFRGFNGIWHSQSSNLALTAANGLGVFKSSDGGSTWTALIPPMLTGGAGSTDYCGVNASDDAVRILVTSCAGNLALSLDGGVTWNYSGNTGGWMGLVSQDGGAIVLADYDFSGSLYKGNYFPISETSGYSSGGTAIVISGSGFSSGTSVTFGGVAASITSWAPNRIELLTPKHAPGIVDIVLSNSGGGSDTLTGAFTYIDPPAVVPVGGGTNFVEVIPTASENSPVSSTFSTLGGTFSAQIPNGAGSSTQKVTVVVAANTVTEATKFSLSPVAGSLNSESGAAIFKLTAALIGGASVSTFASPLEITVPAGAIGSSAAWSIDGFAWSTIPQLTSKILPEGQRDGYFINPDGSFTLLTRHLTFFGFRVKQLALSLKGDAKEIQAGKSAQITTLGGSGIGALVYASLTTSICSVNTAGLVLGNSAGTCLLLATKAASSTYMDASANLSMLILAAERQYVITPVDIKTKISAQSVILKVKALSKTRSSFVINLANKYAGKRVVIVAQTKINGLVKSTEIAQVLLDKSGDAKYITKRVLPKNSIVKLKVGSRYVTSLTV